MFWFLLSIFLIIFETLGFFSFAAFLSGISSFLVGLAIHFEFISHDAFLLQATVFFLCSAIFIGLSWVLMQGAPLPQRQKFQDLVGSQVLLRKTIEKGKIGSINWSGTQFLAKIDENCSEPSLPEGCAVTITGIQGNIALIQLVKE
ncbi:MAG: hypothetical protein Tsb0021_03690 [Chlamydiales bacterium]